MGNQFTTVPDLQPVPNPGPHWDHWGYVPTGGYVPSQQFYSLSYISSNTAWGEYNPNDFTQRPLANDPMNFLGTDDTGLNRPGQYNGWVPGSPRINFPLTVTWYDSNYCTPNNFPKCDMTAVGEFSPNYDVWNHQTKLPTNNYGWQAAMDREVQQYVAGNMTYVDHLNSKDTSVWEDPCEGTSWLDTILPFAGAFTLFIVSNRFLIPILTFTSPESKAVVNFNAFMAGYHIGHLSALPLGADETDGAAAARNLLYAIGFVSGNTVARAATTNTAAHIVVGMGSAFLLRWIFEDSVAVWLDKTLWASTLPGRVVSSAWKGFTDWVCRSTYGFPIACDDSSNFPDARRWNVPDLSAKLVDELCAEEGWSRNSPQAQYAMYALMTTPAWQFAAMEEKPHSTHYDNFAINPLGEVVPSIYTGGNLSAFNGTPAWSLKDILNPDGTQYTNVGHANSSSIACQSYANLRNGTGSGEEADPQLAANFAKRINEWKESVRVSAWNKSNHVLASQIPGMNPRGPIGGFLTPTQYLAVCTQSADAGGFDTLNDRGNYANFYVEKDCDADQWLLIQTNQFLASNTNINDYYEYCVKHGLSYNLCPAIQYIATEPAIGNQRDDWLLWMQHADKNVTDCIAAGKLTMQVPLTFTAVPVEERKVLNTLSMSTTLQKPDPYSPISINRTSEGIYLPIPAPPVTASLMLCWQSVANNFTLYNNLISSNKVAAWKAVMAMLNNNAITACTHPGYQVAVRACILTVEALVGTMTSSDTYPNLAAAVMTLQTQISTEFESADLAWANQWFFNVIITLYLAGWDTTISNNPMAKTFLESWNTNATPTGPE